MTKNTSVESAPKAKKRNIFPFLIGAALIVVAYFVVQGFLYEETDDAYVEAHALMLAPRIGGIVNEVSVKENDKVKAGEVLAQLDDKDYSAGYKQTIADESSVQADLEQAQKDYERVSTLYKAEAVSRQQYDAAVAKFHNLTSRLQADEFKADQAKLNLSYTQIVAPEDGVIAKKSVEPGMVVPAGQALFGFVSSQERWVTANFKETQLSKIKPGQKVDIKVDAISGKKFEGVVDSIGSSTGSTFTLLPPDNSTGNFTKVVQRVPVKIDFSNLTSEDIDRLADGLSAEISIHIR